MESISKSEVKLRDITEEDLPIFYEQQLDSTANYMAAFTAKDPTDKDAFFDHWTKIIADETITIKTILFNGIVTGHVSNFEQFSEPEVSYWIGKEYWGVKVLQLKRCQSFWSILRYAHFMLVPLKITSPPSGYWKNAGLKSSLKIRGFPTQEARMLKNLF